MKQRHERPSARQPDRSLAGRVAAADHPDPGGAAALCLRRALEASVRLRRSPGWRQALILGVVVGAAVLTDPESAVLTGILTGLVLLPWLLWRPAVARLWPVALGAVIAAIVAGLSVYLFDKIGPVAFEDRVMDVIYGAGIRRHVFRLGLEFGSPRFFAAIVVALGLWALVWRSPAELVACVSVPVAVVFVELVLKPLVDRTWQLADSVPTYPSGTAAGVAAWTTLTWLLAMPAVRSTSSTGAVSAKRLAV